MKWNVNKTANIHKRRKKYWRGNHETADREKWKEKYVTSFKYIRDRTVCLWETLKSPGCIQDVQHENS